MRRLFVLIILGVVWASAAYALDIPAKPEGYVNDYAGLLSETTRQKLEQTLANFERTTSNQVVIAIFSGLEGASLEDISIRLAENWKIGSKKNDNGVILLIFKNDRQVRIEVGYGLEGALPDATADQIIRQAIQPAFREGNYDKGVTDAVVAIIRATRGEYKTDVSQGRDRIKEMAPYIFMAIVFFLVIPPICYLMVLIGSVILFGFPAGGIIGALLVITLVCLSQRLNSSRFGQTISRSGHGNFWGGSGFSGGSFGGGGFGGGGGGSFGGGGASGRW